MTTSEHEKQDWRFFPIGGLRTFEEVIDQVRFAIRSGAYRPGHRLPYVGELARAMGVSKPTIGAAIKVLSEAGVLEARRGAAGGLTVVSDDIPEHVMRLGSSWREATVTELVETRRPIELQLVLFAAERGTESDFCTMERAIQQLTKHSGGPTMRRIHYDHLFHYALGRAAKSELLAYYQHQILEQIFLKMRGYFEAYEDVQMVIRLHQQTFDAVRSGSVDRIKEAIDDHLAPLEKFALVTQEVSRPLRSQKRGKWRR